MTEQQIAKLTFRARRGMLELDLLLHNFIQDKISQLTYDELLMFEKLLDFTDPQLYDWLINDITPEDVEIKNFVELIKIHRKHTSSKG